MYINLCTQRREAFVLLVNRPEYLRCLVQIIFVSDLLCVASLLYSFAVSLLQFCPNKHKQFW
jgi:hypothetical protein